MDVLVRKADNGTETGGDAEVTDQELMEIVHKCQDGRAKKFVGAGIVVLNFEWWIDLLKRQGKEIGDEHFFKPVPDPEDMTDEAVKAMEMRKPKKLKSKVRRGASPSVEHFCPTCRQRQYRKTDLFCNSCGQALRWE